MTSTRLLLAGCLVGLTVLLGLLSLTAQIASGQAPPTLPRPDLSGVVRFPPQVPVEVREPPELVIGDDVNVSNNGAPQNETTATVDPTDLTQNRVVAGANDYGAGDSSCGFYRSQDAGSSWVRTLLNRADHQAAGDPAVAIDIFGRIQFVCLHFDRDGNQKNAIILHTSTDGGQSFTTTTVASSLDGTASGGGVFHDKPYVAVGPGGAVYVSWTKFVNAVDGSLESAHIFVAHSADGFSTPVVVSDTPYNQGSVPVVGGDGHVYVAWLRYPTAAGDPFEIRIDRAPVDPITGALTGSFGSDTVVSAINPIPSPFSGQNFRTNSFPTLAAGGTNLYLAWAQQFTDQADIMFSRSVDGGVTWGPPKRVNDDATTRHQFFPWMAVDGQGTIHLVWYDKREDAKNKKFHTYYTRLLEGGLTVLTNQRVSDRASNPSGTDQFGGKFIGDYNGIAAAGSVAYPVFMAYRPSGPGGKFADQEVYSDKVP